MTDEKKTPKIKVIHLGKKTDDTDSIFKDNSGEDVIAAGLSNMIKDIIEVDGETFVVVQDELVEQMQKSPIVEQYLDHIKGMDMKDTDDHRKVFAAGFMSCIKDCTHIPDIATTTVQVLTFLMVSGFKAFGKNVVLMENAIKYTLAVGALKEAKVFGHNKSEPAKDAIKPTDEQLKKLAELPSLALWKSFVDKHDIRNDEDTRNSFIFGMDHIARLLVTYVRKGNVTVETLTAFAKSVNYSRNGMVFYDQLEDWGMVKPVIADWASSTGEYAGSTPVGGVDDGSGQS